MSKIETSDKIWAETLQCAENAMKAKDEVIAAQREQIRYLEEQVSLLEGYYRNRSANPVIRFAARKDAPFIRNHFVISDKLYYRMGLMV